MKYNMAALELTQPIGSFYLGKIDSAVLTRITKTIRRNSTDGIQRQLSEKRAKEISKYCEDPDAAFPTPIILAVAEADIESISEVGGLKDIYEITFDDGYAFAEILDGQHRVEGIKLAKAFQTDLPVVLMFDLTEEEKAYVFSTINSTQTKVDKSLIYDLFDLSLDRSPYKTCHEIARIMNSAPESPFYGRLKMLGKKSTPDAVLSQGTFVNYLCKLISSTPQEDMISLKRNRKLKGSDRLVLRDYFIKERDDIILKLLTNYFSAVAEVFPEEWNNTSKYILSKTTGYGALMKVFPHFYIKGINLRVLSQKFFVDEFVKVKSILQFKGIELTSKDIPSGEQGQNYLASIIKQS